MSTLQLENISIGELTVHLLPTRWCFLGVSVRSLHVRLVTTKNEGSILQEYSKAGLHLDKCVFDRGSNKHILADRVWNCYAPPEKTHRFGILGHRGECARYGG